MRLLLLTPLRQPHNHLPQHKQTLVNVYTLLRCNPSRPSLAYSLRPSQVHQLQLRHDHIVYVSWVDCFNGDCENRVGPAGGLVQVMACDYFVLDPKIEQV